MSSYSMSSHKKYWTFSDPRELLRYRLKANERYCSENKEIMNGFLSVEEEDCLVRHYEKELKDFIQVFMPKNEQLPKEVKGTAFHYYKRFYLVSSVMDFHPKDVILACVFLACKVGEYVVPIDTFVTFVKCAQPEGNPKFLKSLIVYLESELLYRLNFKLNIHTPHRAIEGLMIDLKTRTTVQDLHRLKQHVHRFLSNMWHTDVCLLYSPSLIAVAALTHAASRCHENLDRFVLCTLLGSPPEQVMDRVISTVRTIRSNVFNMREPPNKQLIQGIEEKLAACRNPLNNPYSEEFQKKMMEIALENY